MARWETDWERQRRKAREAASKSEFAKMLKITLWSIGVAAAAFWGFIELQRHHFQVVIKTGPDETDTQSASTPVGRNTMSSPQTSGQNDVVQSGPPALTPALDYDSVASKAQPAASKRSVQEEYEMASRIMESTAIASHQTKISEQVIRTRYGAFPDQLSFNYWWLNRYESECLWQGRGTINYRHCRATWKQQWLDECRDRVLRFEGLSSAQRDIEQPIKEAQCYAANNYQIVE